MGFKLRRDVRDQLPPSALTPAERLVLLEIADDANDDTRRTMKGPDDLSVRVDMTVDAFKKHVQRIETTGIRLRIPIATGSDGRPVYARAGVQTNYLVPPAEVIRAARKGGREGGQTVQPTNEGGQIVQGRADEPSTPAGWTDCPGRVEGLSTPSPQYSSKNSPTPQTDSPAVAPESAAQPEQNPGRKEAERIIKTQTTDIYGTELERLTTTVADAITNGWPTRIIEAELAKPTGGASSIAAVLISRIRKLGQPPTPAAEAAQTPCPLHRGQPNVYTCGVCRSKVLVGEDPYAGCEHLRPADWRDRFPGASRLKPATPATVDTPSQPEPAAPKPVRRCEHGRVAVNCPTCRSVALGDSRTPTSTPEPAPQRQTQPSPCGNPKCVNGRIVVSLNGLNDTPCRECASAEPSDHKDPLVLGELANAKQEQPRQRPPSRHELAGMLGGLVKTID